MTQPTPVATYTGSPTESLLDEARFLTQDVGEGGLWLLSDLEYQYLMDRWLPKYDSIIYVAHMAARIISRKFSGMVNVTADGVSVNVADLASNYTALADQLSQEYDAAQLGETDLGGILASFEDDPTIMPLEFGKGMHDNPAAGRQAYGSQNGPEREAWQW